MTKTRTTNNSKTLFISDLHIDAVDSDITRSLIAVLEEHGPGADAIYILGDLFEVWVGDDDDTPAATLVAEALSRLSEQGTRIYLMHGNRDFLLGHEYAARCGGELLDEPTIIDCYGQKIALLHGDSLCTRDTAYMSFREQVRAPEWQRNFLARPLLERHMVAQQLRQQSQEANNYKTSEIMDVTPQEVLNLLEKLQVNMMIHGHTHRPGIHTIRLQNPINGHNEARRIVLGCWDQKAWVLFFTPEGYDLKPLPHTEA